MTTRYDPNRHHRRSVRLPGYDYAQAGAYFVTLCAHLHECLFGAVVDEQVLLTEFGQVVVEEWHRTAELRPYVRLDSYVVMPNHFHGVIWIVHDRGGTMHRAPTEECFGKPVAGSLSTIVRAFKAAATKRINRMRDTPGARVWQRNYYEHVIRTERVLNAIRQYITDNPARWTLDRYHPAPAGGDEAAVALWKLMQADSRGTMDVEPHAERR